MITTTADTIASKLTLRRKRALAARVLALQEKGRAVFARKDDLFQTLLQGCAIGEVIETVRGAFIIQDNFANGRNVAFRPASVHRFELKEHRPIALPKSRRARGEAPPTAAASHNRENGSIHPSPTTPKPSHPGESVSHPHLENDLPPALSPSNGSAPTQLAEQHPIARLTPITPSE